MPPILKRALIILLIFFNHTALARNAVEQLISIPDNSEEYNKIFDTTPTRGQLEEIKNQINSNISLNDDYKVKTKKDLSNEIERTEADFLILIGHNIEGDFFFPDGNKIPISEIEAMTKDKGKFLIVLSCNASKYISSETTPATSIKITYDAAFSMANAIKKHIENDKSNSSFYPISSTVDDLDKNNLDSSPNLPFLQNPTSRPLSVEKCRDVLSKISTSVRNYMQSSKSITKIIRQQEASIRKSNVKTSIEKSTPTAVVVFLAAAAMAATDDKK